MQKEKEENQSLEFLEKAIKALPKEMFFLKPKINKIIQEIKAYKIPKKQRDMEILSQQWSDKIKESIANSVDPKKSLLLINNLLKRKKDETKLQ